MLLNDLIATYNIEVKTTFDLRYKELEPALMDIAYKYASGAVESVDFIFTNFLGTMEKFAGSRKHDTFPEGYKFTIHNEEWDKAVDIARRKLIRAQSQGSTSGLDLYTKQIESLAVIAKEHPYELALDMLEAGDASTYGLTFDGQNMFDTTHDYSTGAGSQSNLLTGTGTSTAQVYADLQSAVNALEGFYYQQGGTQNSRKRKLNKALKLLVVCPTQMSATFKEIRGAERIGDNTNLFKAGFEMVSRPFTDVNDWYLLNLEDEGLGLKPFLIQVEEEPILDVPNPNDERVREFKIYTYGVSGSWNVAYAAWWKAIMTTNS